MVTLHATVDSPAPLEPEVLIGALPLLLQRCRELPFDADGVSRFPAGRRSGLRLTAGVAGREGARYHIVTATQERGAPGAEPPRPSAPVEFDCAICADNAEVAEVLITYAAGRVRLAVDRPAFPQWLRAQADLEVDDLPGLLGHQITATLTVRLDDLWRLPGPQLAGHVELRAARAAATAEVRPQPEGQWRTSLALTGRPRGLGVLALPAWPFVRRRLRNALTTWLQQTMTEVAEATAAAATGPQDVADRAWTALPDLLAR